MATMMVIGKNIRWIIDYAFNLFSGGEIGYTKGRSDLSDQSQRNVRRQTHLLEYPAKEERQGENLQDPWLRALTSFISSRGRVLCTGAHRASALDIRRAHESAPSESVVKDAAVFEIRPHRAGVLLTTAKSLSGPASILGTYHKIKQVSLYLPRAISPHSLCMSVQWGIGSSGSSL
jgi:hypothetical protein